MKAAFILVGLVFLTGCELIVIGSGPATPVVHVNRETAVGAVYVFKSELDSSNSRGAARAMARPGGAPILALDKYEMFYELDRIGRLIGDKEITRVLTDTLSNVSQRVDVEFEYLSSFVFTTEKIDDSWYIVDYLDKK